MTLCSSLRQPLGEQDDGRLTTRDKMSSSSSSRPEISPYQAGRGEGSGGKGRGYPPAGRAADPRS